jgi:hypothetical protein
MWLFESELFFQLPFTLQYVLSRIVKKKTFRLSVPAQEWRLVFTQPSHFLNLRLGWNLVTTSQNNSYFDW